MLAALAAALVLAPGPVVDSDPAPPPSRIVFASTRTTVSQLYSVEPSGERLAQLTFGAGGWGPPGYRPMSRGRPTLGCSSSPASRARSRRWRSLVGGRGRSRAGTTTAR